MPLVKGGKIIADTFVPVADDAALPERRRCPGLGDAVPAGPGQRCCGARGKTGVIWPNNRDVDDLVPYLDRLAVVALVFPSFRDGRAYSQARLLRERFHYRGELRATGQVLRDQFVFMLRAGFDAFEVQEAERCGGLRADREALFGVLPADRRRPHHRAAPADAAASFRKCGTMTAHASQLIRRVCRRAAGGSRELDLRAARCVARGGHRGGAENRRPRAACAGVVVRHRIGGAAQGDGRRRSGHPRALSRHRLAVCGDAGLSRHADRDAGLARCPHRSSRSEETLAREDPRWRIVVLRSRCLLPDPQSGAAGARAEAVCGLDQRAQALPGRPRARRSPVVEADGDRLKFNPFANVSREEIAAIYAIGQAAAASAGCLGLPVGGLHALHAENDGRRGRARRPLARPAQDGMRHPHDQRLPSTTTLPHAQQENAVSLTRKPFVARYDCAPR